jgi:hypothetical protein
MYLIFKKIFLKQILRDFQDSFGWNSYEFIEMNDSEGRGTSMSWKTFCENFKRQ